jgi:phosphohistidine phosphatase
MKTLYLVRHGKSSWDSPTAIDRERPLLEKGIERTRKVAGFLNEKGVKPDLIIASHAVRARETAKILADGLSYPQDKIRIEEGVYFNGFSSIEGIILSMDEKVNQLMIVGHNPDMTEYANQFLETKADYLPTTGTVAIQFDAKSWNEIFVSDCKILYFIRPADL